MNTNQYSQLGLNPILMSIVNEILGTPIATYSNCWGAFPMNSFIKIKDRVAPRNHKNDEVIFEAFGRSTLNRIDSFYCEESTKNYCFWNQNEEASNDEKTIQKDLVNFQDYDTYKQLKMIAKESNPGITKEEIYDQLLIPFRHEKIKKWDESQGRYKISYFWRYDGCNKIFNKTWNLQLIKLIEK